MGINAKLTDKSKWGAKHFIPASSGLSAIQQPKNAILSRQWNRSQGQRIGIDLSSTSSWGPSGPSSSRRCGIDTWPIGILDHFSYHLKGSQKQCASQHMITHVNHTFLNRTPNLFAGNTCTGSFQTICKIKSDVWKAEPLKASLFVSGISRPWCK